MTNNWRQKWSSSYNKIIQSVFRCSKGTNLKIIYNQLHTMKLENKLTVKPPHTEYYAEIQFSEVMANALGFQQIPRNISYTKTSKEQLKSAIDWAADALRSLELNIIQATDESESETGAPEARMPMPLTLVRRLILGVAL